MERVGQEISTIHGHHVARSGHSSSWHGGLTTRMSVMQSISEVRRKIRGFWEREGKREWVPVKTRPTRVYISERRGYVPE